MATGLTSFRTPEPLSLVGNLAENFNRFIQRYNVYMKASRNAEQAEDIKAAIFLNLVGDEAHEVFNTFGLTDEEAESEEKIIKAFRDYCMPRKNVIYERYLFYNRGKRTDEPFDQFLTEIKKLVRSCEFSDNESMLRDRIVLGINDPALQERMLRMPELTLSLAVEYCRAAEISQKQVKILQGASQIDLMNVKSNESDKIPKGSQSAEINCKKCGRKHEIQRCPAYGKRCNRCKKYNHFAVGCSANEGGTNKANWKNKELHTTEGVATDQEAIETFMLNGVECQNNKRWYETVMICNNEVQCKLDTGADVNVMPSHVIKGIKGKHKFVLEHKPMRIVTYGGNTITPLGVVKLKCKIKGRQEVEVEFVVVDVTEVTILGLTTCIELNLVKRLSIVRENRYLDKENFIEKNVDIFEGVGCFPNEQKIVIQNDAQPVVRPFYRIAESLRSKLKDTLEQYEKNGFIAKVNEPTDWVHNLVIVEKQNGELRLCLDPKELNKVVKREHYPIPTGDEMTPHLANKKWYTVLDMKDGFFQLKLDDNSSKLCAFHTPYGRYRFQRMPFGLASAPEIFQKATSQMFGDIEGVLVYFDDLIISAETQFEHDQILGKVIERARNNNIKFNKSKVQFRVDRVRYIGQVFSEKGISPDPKHVEAIINLHDPTNKKELQGMLGMINYIAKFVPHLSQLTAPVRGLLKKNAEWCWDETHSRAISKLKTLIAQVPVLRCFDAKKPLTIQADSSKDGMGCCLLLGKEPISFASRSLTKTEQNYAQIEKELLSIRFATQKFHTFIYGRRVLVQTDHKPLEAIVTKEIGKISPRLQRMCLGLLKYNLDIKYLPGRHMYIADLLSRNFQKSSVMDDPSMAERVHAIDIVLPVSEGRLKQLQEGVQNDKALSKIKEYCLGGWPRQQKSVDSSARWAWKLKNQLRVKQEIVLLENKIVIPRSLVTEMLDILHQSHLGIVKCKKRARQLLYWVGMSTDIEKTIQQCRICEKHQRANTKEPIIQHKVPELPFEVVGTDICSYAGKDYLVTACYLTKWIEVQELRNKTAEEVINQLKTIFSTHGIPRAIVSDNMPFASYSFKQFLDGWGIQQILTSPHYPKANGLVERMVGVAKQLLKKTSESKGDLRLSLLDYRNSPLDGMEVSPAQLLMSRRLRSTLPGTAESLKPKIVEQPQGLMQRNKKRQQFYYDKNSKKRSPMRKGDSILIKKEKKWEPGTVTQALKAPRSYLVKDQSGRVYRRNKIDLRASKNPPPRIQFEEEGDNEGEGQGETEQSVAPGQSEETCALSEGYRTRSGRLVKPPSRYADFV